MKKIRMVVEFEDLGNGDTGFGVTTDPFRIADMPSNVGELWVGVSLAINDYVRQNGFPGFDCMRKHRQQ